MWRIHNTKNDVEISKELADKLYKAQLWGPNPDYPEDEVSEGGEWWESRDMVDYKGKFYFNSDWMEHMDCFMWDDERIIPLLLEAKAKGEIAFCSHGGDNAGSAWGWIFDGEGNVKEWKTSIEELMKNRT